MEDDLLKERCELIKKRNLIVIKPLFLWRPKLKKQVKEIDRQLDDIDLKIQKERSFRFWKEIHNKPAKHVVSRKGLVGDSTSGSLNSTSTDSSPSSFDFSSFNSSGSDDSSSSYSGDGGSFSGGGASETY